MNTGQYSKIGPYIFTEPTRKVGKYIIGIANAYDAYGLIGPEHNGIFILDDEAKCVVADRLLEQQTGYFGPNELQLRKFYELAKGDEKNLELWFGDLDRTRPEYRRKTSY